MPIKTQFFNTDQKQKAYLGILIFMVSLISTMEISTVTIPVSMACTSLRVPPSPASVPSRTLPGLKQQQEWLVVSKQIADHNNTRKQPSEQII